MGQKLTGEKRKRIIEKIQKLFNRAESTVVDSDNNEEVDHEAQLALETARTLMLRYGLEAHDVETVSVGKKSELGGEGVNVFLGISNPGSWVKSLAVVVADYFFVKVLYEKGSKGDASFLYYGVKVGVEAAAYALESCFNQIRTLSRRYKVERSSWENCPYPAFFRTWERYRDLAKEEYRTGIVMGFHKRLKEIKSEDSAEVTALTIAYDKIAEEFLNNLNYNVRMEAKPREKPYTGGGHYRKGLKDSKDVVLVRGMSGDVIGTP